MNMYLLNSNRSRVELNPLAEAYQENSSAHSKKINLFDGKEPALNLRRSSIVDDMRCSTNSSQIMPGITPLTKFGSFKDVAKFVFTHRTLNPRYYLEVLDPLHRPPKVYRPIWDEWKKGDTKLPFFEHWAQKENGNEVDHSAAEQVIYFNAEEKKQYAACIGKDGFWRRTYGTTQLIDTSSLKGKQEFPGHAIFVVDKNRTIYIYEYKQGQLQHSSALHGKAHLSAGMIRIVNGKVDSFVLSSGHYVPGGKELTYFLDLLSEKDRKKISISAYILQDEVEQPEIIKKTIINATQNQKMNMLSREYAHKIENTYQICIKHSDKV